MSVALPTNQPVRPRLLRWRDRSFWRTGSTSEVVIEEAGTAFTVMTYNLGNGLADPKRLVTTLRSSTADLIGLQEVESGHD